MSYIFLVGAGEESTAGCFADIPLSARSNLSHTDDKSSCNASGMESSPASQFGATLPLSTEPRGGESLTLLAEDSPAKTLVPLDHKQDWRAVEAVFGVNRHELSARYDLISHSWKTHQDLWEMDLQPSLVTLPKWGTMRRGVFWGLPMPSGLKEHRAWITSEIESGSSHGTQRAPTPTKCASKGTSEACLTRKNGKSRANDRIDHWLLANRLPTPTVCGNYNRKGASATSGDGLAAALRRLSTPTKSDASIRKAPENFTHSKTGILRHLNAQGIESQTRICQQIAAGGPINPEWIEWFMGWPIGATALRPLGMDKFREWYNSHGGL